MICFKVFTLFPEVIHTYIENNAPLRRAQESQLIKIDTVNFRDYSDNRHKKVDDEVYGGGPGMLISPSSVISAVRSHKKENSKILILDPRGKVLNNEMAKNLAKESEIFLICGRYEGFDQRIIDILGAQMISLGDYVLTGGELGALAVIDASSRFIEGSLDDFDSQENESFNHGFLEHDQYTRPPQFEGLKIPDELNSGHHMRINNWKLKNSLKNTLTHRPDLLKKINLSSQERSMLMEIISENFSEK